MAAHGAQFTGRQVELATLEREFASALAGTLGITLRASRASARAACLRRSPASPGRVVCGAARINLETEADHGSELPFHHLYSAIRDDSL